MRHFHFVTISKKHTVRRKNKDGEREREKEGKRDRVSNRYARYPPSFYSFFAKLPYGNLLIPQKPRGKRRSDRGSGEICKLEHYKTCNVCGYKSFPRNGRGYAPIKNSRVVVASSTSGGTTDPSGSPFDVFQRLRRISSRFFVVSNAFKPKLASANPLEANY